jgi:hypothetical protein
MIVDVERDGDRVMVISGRLPVPMIRIAGVWRVGVFPVDDTTANFRMATGEEAEALFQEAVETFWRDKDQFMREKKANDAAYEEWKKTKSTEFTVHIDDNFRPYDSSDRITGPTFSTFEEAVAECKRIVDRNLRWLRLGTKDPNDPEELYRRYTGFGDDPFIKTDGPDGPSFSAWEYAKERCKKIVKEDINDKTLYNFR